MIYACMNLTDSVQALWLSIALQEQGYHLVSILQYQLMLSCELYHTLLCMEHLIVIGFDNFVQYCINKMLPMKVVQNVFGVIWLRLKYRSHGYVVLDRRVTGGKTVPLLCIWWQKQVGGIRKRYAPRHPISSISTLLGRILGTRSLAMHLFTQAVNLGCSTSNLKFPWVS